MNKKELLLQRLDEIGKQLSQTEGALALLALGSCGVETDRLDEYSDLDFFVICKDGYKQQFLESLEWLSSVHPLAFSFKNSNDGHKVIFEDDILCETAVFEPHELKNMKGMKGRIVWQQSDFNSQLCVFEPLEKHPVNIDHSINEALTNLYVGLGRYHRGEKLSAYHFICIFAVIHTTNLITTLEEATAVSEDPYSVPRRFETRYPAYKDILPDIMTSYDETPKAAKKIVTFLDENFTINTYLKERILELCDK